VHGDLRAERAAALDEDGPVAFAQSFDDFFEMEHERLLGALYLVTGNLPEAEDLMQDAFVKVLQRWDLVRSLADPTGYLYRTAMNGFRTTYRRARMAIHKMTSLTRAEVDPFSEVEVREDVRRALAALTPRQRAAIVLTELLGYPPSEAARSLGIKASTVRALTTQARATLRGTLAGERDG
jgi:RNA polymerase sigma-70 factor (ECF subfamily)